MSELPTIITEEDLDQTITHCIENGYAKYQFSGGRLLLELNQDKYIAGTFYYDHDYDDYQFGSSNGNPEIYVTHLEDLVGGCEQVQNLHTVVVNRDDVVYTHVPKLGPTGEFDFGFQYRNK